MIWEAENVRLVYAVAVAWCSWRMRRLNSPNWWTSATSPPCAKSHAGLLAHSQPGRSDPDYISMPGMHGSYAANMALTESPTC